jgi:hypothetical protein
MEEFTCSVAIGGVAVFTSISFSLLVLMITGCNGGGTPVEIITWVISALAGFSPIVIRASSKFAGAIESLTWNGKEFIDPRDAGRLLQSASSFDGHGECYNPTEGGAWRDNQEPARTTSILKDMKASGGTITSTVQMAYWLRPGDTSGGKPAVNTVELSDHLLTKIVKIGHPASDHIVDYKVCFHVPRDYASGRFEALTAYMPAEFDTVWRFNPATGEIQQGEGDNMLPLILSSGDYAMGIYSKGAIYDSFSAADLQWPVVKWNVLFTREPVKAGDYDFQCYAIVGSLENVKVSMRQLYNYG